MNADAIFQFKNALSKTYLNDAFSHMILAIFFIYLFEKYIL